MSRVRLGLGPLQRSLEANPGSSPPSATVVGSQELDRWKALVEASSNAKEQAEERAHKKDLSTQRHQQWGNTLDGLHQAKEEARRRRLDEAEQRRVLIDLEEAALQEARRQATVDEANHQIADRDERVHRLNTQLKLHSVMKERDAQVELSARRRAEADSRSREYDAMVVQQAELERLRSIELAQAARARAVEVQELRRAQLEETKAQIAAQRQAAREEGKEIRRLAEEAAAQAVQAKRDARERARTIEVELMHQHEEKIASRNRHVGEGTADSGAEDTELLSDHAVRKSQQLLELRARQEAKRQAKEGARLVVADQFAQHVEPKPRSEMIDRIESGRSLNDVIHQRDSERKARQQKAKEELKLELSTAVSPSKVNSARERAHDATVAAVVGKRVVEEEELDREAVRQSRLTLQSLQRIHQLQAQTKKDNEALYESNLRAEGEHQRALREQEDRMFEAYIRSQLPKDMPQALVAKALSSPRPLRAS